MRGVDEIRAVGTDFDDDEKTKREEMFDPSTRFLLLLRPPHNAHLHTNLTSKANDEYNSIAIEEVKVLPEATEKSGSKKKKKKPPKLDFTSDQLIGYCSFRFDTEDTINERSVEVIYWYVQQLNY